MLEDLRRSVRWCHMIYLYSYFSSFYDSMAIFTRGKVGPWPTSERWVQHGPSSAFLQLLRAFQLCTIDCVSAPPRGAAVQMVQGAASWLVVVIRDSKSWTNCIRNCRIPYVSMVLEYVPTCFGFMWVNVGKHSLLGLLKPPNEKQWKATGTSTFMTIALDELDCPAVKNHRQQWHSFMMFYVKSRWYLLVRRSCFSPRNGSWKNTGKPSCFCWVNRVNPMAIP